MVDARGAALETSPMKHTRAVVGESLPQIKEHHETVTQLPARTLLLSTGTKGRLPHILAEYRLTQQEMIAPYEADPTIFAREKIIQAPLNDANSIIHELATPPDMILVDLPTPTALETNDENIVDLVYNYWSVFKKQNRPVVIMNCPGYEVPLFVQSRCQGFLFASTPDELVNRVSMGNTLLAARDKPADFTPATLSTNQERQYDASDDLREWEHQTADTYQSLKYLLSRIDLRNALSLQDRNTILTRLSHLFPGANVTELPAEKETPIDKKLLPIKPIKTILEVGAGEGRIGGMLARLGFHVLGIDISSKMLERAEARLIEEGEGLRGERSDPHLSYNALRQLETEGVLPQPPILNDEEAQRNYILAQGNLFQLYPELNQLLREWQHRYPDIDRAAFMDTHHPSTFTDRQDMLADAGVDMVLFNWHTLNEVGDLENQKRVLEQVRRVLLPGGEIVIEIPNRDMPPYSDALQAYHATHPHEPFGMLRDTIQSDAGETQEYSPRYFPSLPELQNLLTALGYDIDPAQDIQSYTIGDNEPGGTSFEEYFVTARKPR